MKLVELLRDAAEKECVSHYLWIKYSELLRDAGEKECVSHYLWIKYSELLRDAGEKVCVCLADWSVNIYGSSVVNYKCSEL